MQNKKSSVHTEAEMKFLLKLNFINQQSNLKHQTLSGVSVYGTYPSLYIMQNKLQGSESKPVNQLGTSNE